MTIVLDSGGLSMLAANRARLAELRRRDEWPAVVPAVVLTEALTGDHRRDFHENRLLRTCDVRPVDELLAREAAALRFKAATGSRPSAADALVAAVADVLGGATVLTGDVGDLKALARHTIHDVVISPV
jgi:predicted nucleic acid-binding protein